MTAALLSNCRVVAPHGIAGGGDGKPGKNLIVRRDGATEQLEGTVQIAVAAGDRLIIATPGGGGYGPCLTNP